MAAAPGPLPAAAATEPLLPADAPAPDPGTEPAQPAHADASISGEIREGNRSPPAMRICAHPVAGGAATCIDSPAGATEYRIGVTPGRYYLMGWTQGGAPALRWRSEAPLWIASAIRSCKGCKFDQSLIHQNQR